MRRLLLLLLIILPPAPPEARWSSPTRAVVSWAGDGHACLVKRPNILIGCYDGPQAITLGSGGDAAFQPRAGDVFELWRAGEHAGVVLGARPIYLPLLRTHNTRPVVERVLLPVVRG